MDLIPVPRYGPFCLVKLPCGHHRAGPVEGSLRWGVLCHVCDWTYFPIRVMSPITLNYKVPQ